MSIIVLGAAFYLLWTWYQGTWIQDPDGDLLRARDDWRLWVGGALLAWSFVGRFVTAPLLGGKDHDPLRLERSNGQTLRSATGADIYFEVHGALDAPPLILTHGWSLDSRIWHYAKRDLAKQFRVITWDLPGLGKSSRLGAKVDLSTFAQDLASVLTLAGGKPAILVGHSIGGIVIQTLARDQPQLFGRKVRGIVLLHTTYTNPLKTMILSGLAQAIRWPVLEPLMRLTIILQPLAWLSSWQSYLSGSTHIGVRLGFGRSVTRSQLDRTALLMTEQKPAVSARGDLAMFRWDSEDALARLRVPTLVIGGDMDIVTKPNAARHIANSAPASELVIISGVNHMGPVERADLYHRQIVKFAGSLS
ncbi:alpha/beta fold hydrolase [Novosphingobium sp. 9U]|uniref:alpha/beta fold hydrolase n=1 Tax=Novosphingobium sp. 9U TaxID=2653158 RepID=UPI0012F01441|nr:alpha/beta hydrolase [Novosphingobium sp. 9U]VWX49393.1 Pimeloyl-ACP methyl ester carboxylesterase [Novosphingobium sp. 9U]